MNASINRRQAIVAVAAGAVTSIVARNAVARSATERKFTIDLCPGRIGVGGTNDQWLKWAKEFGFESIEPDGAFLARLTAKDRQSFVAEMQSAGIRWGAAGLPVEFRKDEKVFQEGLAALPAIAEALKLAGVDRMGTYIMPRHAELTYTANMQQHASRLRLLAEMLRAYGIRLGLEYVGPKTLWASARYPFIHTLAETQDLIREINRDNVGLVLDSWHWYTSADPLEDLAKLSNQQVVAVDLNDAPAGLERDQQIDSQRTLPVATGVIDVRAFLQMLVDIGYDGPVRAEPFDKQLNELDDRAALQKTSQSMHAAVALLDQTP
jgi:sugar phosphate isomerase/epimerase